jgi:hypothetical protein
MTDLNFDDNEDERDERNGADGKDRDEDGFCGQDDKYSHSVPVFLKKNIFI